MRLVLLSRLAVCCLPGLLACSTPDQDEPRTAEVQVPAQAPAKGPFVGTIRLLERHSLLGLRKTDYVTMTFRGPQLRREVRPNGFADSTYRYGILVDLRTDSVTYYLQNDTLNTYCRIPSDLYLRQVAEKQPILSNLNLNWRPYCTVFSPFPANVGLPHQALNPGAAVEGLTDLRGVVFLFPDRTRCETVYSEQVKVAPKLLDYIEYQAPAALPTLALTVHYTTPSVPGAAGESGLLDRVKQRLNEPSEQLEFNGIDRTAPSDRAFRPPAGSRYAGTSTDLDAKLYRPSPPSSSSSSHHSIFD